MRMAAETSDDVSVAGGLICGELEHAALLLRRVFDKLLCEIDRSLQIRELFRNVRGARRRTLAPATVKNARLSQRLRRRETTTPFGEPSPRDRLSVGLKTRTEGLLRILHSLTSARPFRC